MARVPAYRLLERWGTAWREEKEDTSESKSREYGSVIFGVAVGTRSLSCTISCNLALRLKIALLLQIREPVEAESSVPPGSRRGSASPRSPR